MSNTLFEDTKHSVWGIQPLCLVSINRRNRRIKRYSLTILTITFEIKFNRIFAILWGYINSIWRLFLCQNFSYFFGSEEKFVEFGTVFAVIAFRLLHEHYLNDCQRRSAGNGASTSICSWLTGCMETHSASQQRDAAIGVATTCSILQVAFYRASYRCQLAAYLMVSACQQIDFEQRVSVRPAYLSVAQYGMLSIRCAH